MLFQQECYFSHLDLIPFRAAFFQGVVAQEGGRVWSISLVSDLARAADEIKKRWPHATLSYPHSEWIDFEQICRQYLLVAQGTSFQIQVWKELLRIPYGETQSYQQVAERIESRGAARAVGRAVSLNPLAYVIPCHRVIHHDGTRGHYRWGCHLKKKLLEEEAFNKSCFCH